MLTEQKTDIMICFIIYPNKSFPAVGTFEDKTETEKQRRRVAGREC